VPISCTALTLWCGCGQHERAVLGAQPNAIESTEAFFIKVLGRTGLRYIEEARSVWIDSEVLAKPRAIAVVQAKHSILGRLRAGEVAPEIEIGSLTT
jgi:hypothetical protein